MRQNATRLIPGTARSLGTRTNAGELELWNPQGGPAHPDFAPREPMSTMSSEVLHRAHQCRC